MMELVILNDAEEGLNCLGVKSGDNLAVLNYNGSMIFAQNFTTLGLTPTVIRANLQDCTTAPIVNGESPEDYGYPYVEGELAWHDCAMESDEPNGTIDIIVNGSVLLTTNGRKAKPSQQGTLYEIELGVRLDDIIWR